MLVKELIVALKSHANLHLPIYFQQMSPCETGHPIYGLERVYLWPEDSTYYDRFLDEAKLKEREDSFRERKLPLDIADFHPAYIFDHDGWADDYVRGKPALTGRGLLKLLQQSDVALEVVRPYLSDDRFGTTHSVAMYLKTMDSEMRSGHYFPIDAKLGPRCNPAEFQQIVVIE